MPKKSPIDSKGMLRCPVCGNRGHFVVLTITVRVRPILQVGARRWKVLRPTPRRFEPSVPLLLICESCAHPVGAPEEAQVRRLRGMRRKPSKRR